MTVNLVPSAPSAPREYADTAALVRRGFRIVGLGYERKLKDGVVLRVEPAEGGVDLVTLSRYADGTGRELCRLRLGSISVVLEGLSEPE